MTQSVDFVLNLKANVEEAMRGVKAVQNGLGQLKLPKGLESSFEKSFGNLEGLVKKFNDQLNKGVKTKGDVTGLERLTNQIDVEMNKISKDLKKLTGQEIHFKVDTTEIKKARNELEKAIEDRNKFAASQADVKIGKSGKSANELLDQMSAVAGSSKTGNAVRAAKEALNAGDIKEYLKQLAYVERYYNLLKKGKEELFTGISPGKAFDLLKGTVSDSSSEMEAFNKRVAGAGEALKTAVANGARDAATQVQGLNDKFEKEKQVIEGAERAQEQLANQSQNLNQNIGQLESHIAMYFSFAAILRKVTQIARKAFQTVKELDAAMVETAVVTNFDVGDMWSMLPTYTENANALGSTIKDVYEAATLYYQQGLNTAQAMGLANETLKMARIGGLEAAEATDMMTAALRGFNMQINEMSAQKVNDVYSKLAAITASDTRELGSAMERTASIANSANMEFETTTAFLAQMIETTREAPENLGTAMKTIVARFQEMKQDPTKLIDSEGEMLDANRVDTALKTIGVNLMDVNGQFRDLDDVFLEISSKWGGLTQAQQRYIATIAAGSRQQSRFIAMMQNYDRTMELVEAANNSTGASQEQFDKTLEGLDAKLNKLKNAWDQFAMGLANNKIIKLAVDGMTDLFTIINKILGVLDNIPDPFGGVTKSLVTLLAVVKGMGLAGTILTGGVSGLSGWARGEEKFGATTPFGAIGKGIGAQFEEVRTAKVNAAANRAAASQAGAEGGEAYKASFIKKIQEIDFKQISFKAKAASNISAQTFINELYPSNIIDEEAREKASEIVTRIQQSVEEGTMSARSGLNAIKVRFIAAGLDASNIDPTSQKLQDLISKAGTGQKVFNSFGTSINNTGNYIQQFGILLQKTPLAPFSGILTSIGFTLSTLGNLVTGLNSKILLSTVAILAEAKALDKDTVSTVKNKIAKGELTREEAKETLSRGFSTLMKQTDANGKALGVFGSLKKIIGQIISKIGTLGKVIGGIGIFVAVGLALHKVTTMNQKAAEKAASAAGTASDAYSSAAQATSELRDNLDQLREVNDGFEGLVAGTAAFNEQLIKSNELILQLLKKYPMLYDYLSTDKNGRMIISDEGLEEVLEYQKQITSQAAALNTIMNGDYRAKQAEAQLEINNNDIASSWTPSKDVGGVTEEEAERIKKLEEENKLLQQQTDAYRRTARETAINTVLSDQELSNQEALTQLYADQYDERKKNVDLSKEEAYQKYADYYNYDYRDGKLYDFNGDEVTDVTEKEVKDAAKDIVVLTQFELDAESLNRLVEDANDYFRDNITIDLTGNLEGRDSFISDIIARNPNANEDLVRAALGDSSILHDIVNDWDEADIAAYLGIDLDTVKQDADKYRDEVVKVWEDSLNDIADVQKENYADLGIMLAKSRGYNAGDRKLVYNDVFDDLSKLNQKQRNSILTAGKALQEAAGQETMKAIVGGMTDIYKNGGPIDEMQEIIDDINWDSPIERLTAFKELANSSSEELKNMGNELLNLNESSNLLGDAFEEMYDSTDFQKALEDFDKYADATGKIDASGVKELAENSSTLNKMLEAGIMTTGGVAKALNTLQVSGDISLLNLNQDILILLDNMGKLDTIIGEAHSYIENFDPGIDTGEADTFIADAVKSWNELYENGEYGNSQLQRYSELIYGAENFSKSLKDHQGDLKATYDDMLEDVNSFSDGYYNIWSRLADEGLDWISHGEGTEIKLTGIESMEDLIAKVQSKGYSREFSVEAAESLLNFSPDMRVTFEAKAFEDSFRDPNSGFIKNRTTYDNGLAISQTELNTLTAATGKNEEEIIETIAAIRGIEESQVQKLNNLTEEGTARTDYDNLSQEQSEMFYGPDADKYAWMDALQSDVIDGAINLKEAIDTSNSRYTEDQTLGMIYEGLKDGKVFEYEGEQIDPDEIKNQEDLLAKMEDLEENSHWKTVGDIIAEAIVKALEKTDKRGKEPGFKAKEATEKYKTSEKKTPSTETETTVIPNTPDIKEARIQITPELQVGELKEQLEKSGIDDKTITITTVDGNGSLQEFKVNLDEIPDDVTVLAGLQDNFSQPLTDKINGFAGSEVRIAGNLKDQFSERLQQAIKGFSGAYVQIPVNMSLTAKAKEIVRAFMQNKYGYLATDAFVGGAVVNAGSGTNFSSYGGGTTSTGRGGGGSTGGSGGGGGGGSDDKPKHITINNWSIQEALRHNYEKKIENYQHLVDNWMKKLDKSLERVSTKVSDVTGNINNQVDYLKSIKNQNDNLAKSYQISLNALDKGPYNVTISYDKNGESEQEDVNISDYIYKDQWGNYLADTAKINQAGNQARKEAIFKAIDGVLGPLVSGLQNAEDAAQDAQDAIDELYKKVYDTFYGWKNEINEIYNLSQKIAIDDAERSRLASHVNMELARIGAGFSDIPTAISNSIATIQRSNLTLMNQLETSRDMMAAQERELIRAASFTSEIEEYGNLWYKYGENNAATQEAKDIYLAVKRALTYVNISKNLDGTITYEIDWKGFEEAKENGEITEEAYEIMKDKLDNLEEQAKKMHEVIEDTDKILTETYEAIIDYKKEIADVEDKLIKQLEDNLKEQIDNTKKLSDAIKNALKNLLDEVKRKLDERRQKEDNEKTERDITNKQQRLALLRSSSAGNQVEIAQLEKEISDAQQSYQRTLEDQLLNKLQQQGDEAARQRERQIAIAQAQLDLSKSTNRELVNLWLSDPETYKDEIIKALLEADNYDEKGTYGQEVAEADANKTYVQLVTNLNQTNSEIEGTVANIAKKIEEFKKLLNDKLDNAFRGTNVLSDVIERTLSGEGTFTKALTSLKELLDYHLSAREISSVVKQENGGALSAKALHDVGFTAKQAYDAGYGYDALKEAGYDLSEIRKAGYGAPYVLAHDNTVTPEDLRNAGYLAKDLYNAGYDYNALRQIGYDLSEMYRGGIDPRTIVFNDESVTFEDLIKVGYKPSTVAAAFAALQKKKARENRHKTSKEAHTKRYATGGIADYTGPAWLDGTPTKPELVLNQQDTKNFLQLKDVLSSVMRGGAFDTPAAVGAGDMNYEININVDHIENDYDVDKIANRVKKIIVQDSTYRNVTSVRKFR